MPVCTKCGEEEPAADFYRRSERPSGRYPACKDCHDHSHPEERRQRGTKYSANKLGKRSEIAAAVVGRACVFCGYRDRLVIHRKDGQPHPPFHRMGQAAWEQEVRSGEYVRVCFFCHKAVHWCRTHLGLSWEGILGLALGADDPCKIVMRGSIPRSSTQI